MTDATKYSDWNPTLADGIDPDSRIAKTIKAISAQWDAAKGIATKLRASIARRYEVYDLHSTEASKIASLRQQRAMEFLDASVEIGDRIRNVRNEVREEIAADRQRIRAAFRAEAAQLRFWNVIKHAKASIRYAARLAVHRARLALHPLAMRTMRRRAILRTQLRAEGANFLHTDGHPGAGTAGTRPRGLDGGVAASGEATGNGIWSTGRAGNINQSSHTSCRDERSITRRQCRPEGVGDLLWF